MDEKKKRIIIGISLIVVLILIVTGISYATFTYVGKGEQVNQITTGTIQMNYEESTNVIRLNNALPTTDATGKVRLIEGEYFDFSVTTNITGDATINFEIAAEDFNDNTFDGANVKFYLTKLVDGNEVEVNASLPTVYSEKTTENSKTGRPANMMSLLTGSTSTEGEEVTNYRLRLYVDETYNPQGDGGGLIFKTRINVYGKVSTEVSLPVMKRIGSSYNGDFHTYEYRERITEIKMKTNKIIPETALKVTGGKGNYWDMSESQDDSIIAYLENNGTNSSGLATYKVTIGTASKIMANPDSSYIFSDFSSLETLDLSIFDTSNVTDMNHMFSHLYSVTNLDVSNFDTSKVTDMSGMFLRCQVLTNLDVSGFDTSKVTNMLAMFQSCRLLDYLDVTNFDTSNVVNMSFMFSDCNFSTLNLRNFDTSKVTDMTYMFYYSKNLWMISVGNLWITENACMDYMFDGCGTDHVTTV